MTIPAIIKALQMQLCKAGCEVQLNTEQRWYAREGYISCRYKIIYWLTPKEANKKKEKIEKEFTRQTDVIKELQSKLKEWKARKGGN